MVELLNGYIVVLFFSNTTIKQFNHSTIIL